MNKIDIKTSMLRYVRAQVRKLQYPYNENLEFPPLYTTLAIMGNLQGYSSDLTDELIISSWGEDLLSIMKDGIHVIGSTKEAFPLDRPYVLSTPRILKSEISAGLPIYLFYKNKSNMERVDTGHTAKNHFSTYIELYKGILYVAGIIDAKWQLKVREVE